MSFASVLDAGGFGFPIQKNDRRERGVPVLQTLLLIFLVILLIGALPTWPYSASWGYFPSGGLGLLVIVLLLFALFRPPRTL